MASLANSMESPPMEPEQSTRKMASTLWSRCWKEGTKESIATWEPSSSLSTSTCGWCGSAGSIRTTRSRSIASVSASNLTLLRKYSPDTPTLSRLVTLIWWLGLVTDTIAVCIKMSRDIVIRTGDRAQCGMLARVAARCDLSWAGT